MKRAVAARIDTGRVELPILPEMAQRVAQATRDDHTDVRKLAALVMRDQALAAHVMRIANSALYGAGGPIVSLQQAVARLGMERIRQIALQVACQGAVFFVPGRMVEVRALFRQALAAAFLTAEIARMRRRNVEEGYLCGLLHGVGRPVLLQLIGKLEKSLGTSFEPEIVSPVIAEYHAKAGALLTKAWNLPEALQLAVAFHEQPQEAGDHIDGATMTNYGAALAQFALAAVPAEEAAVRDHQAIGPLNLYPADVEALLAFCRDIDSIIQELS